MLSGCATKSYPTITPLTEFEVANMTCEDLVRASAEADEYEAEIRQELSMDMDTVTGILIDGGIRNSIAHDNAEEDLERRRSSIALAASAKSCDL